MREILQDHHNSVSIGGTPLFNLDFVDNIDLIVGSKWDLQNLTKKLARRVSKYRMEIRAVKSNVRMKTIELCKDEILVNGLQLQELSYFKHLLFNCVKTRKV